MAHTHSEQTAWGEGQSYWQARSERAEGALREIKQLETDDLHVGYDSHGGNYIYVSAIRTADAFPIIDRVLADAQQTQKPEEVRDERD